jgi:hypothetical protein
MGQRTAEKDIEQRYQLYLEERKLLIGAEAEGARSFDKAVLMVASGSFAVSIAFLKDVVPVPLPQSRWLILVAWFFFAASILSIIGSFLTTQAACRKQILLSHDSLVEARDDASNGWNTATHALNIFGPIELVGGFIFWSSFVYRNF